MTNLEMKAFELADGFGEDDQAEPVVDFIGVDEREHALDCLAYYADILFGDIVLVPFADGKPDWDNVTRDSLTKFAGHWSELEPEDVPRLGILTDSFARFLGDGTDDVSVVTLLAGGTPDVRQIGGDDCPAAHHLVTDAIIDDEPLKVRRTTAPEEPPKKEPPKAANDNRPASAIDAQTLLGLKFPPVSYVVPGVITEGLTILGGRPKLGKSWLALDVAIAVASGGNALGVRCEQGDALYLALEDNQRRLQDRLRVLLPPLKSLWPDLSHLELDTEAPKIDGGLIQRLDAWRLGAKNPRLVIVDTLAMVRPARKKTQDSYEADYATLSPLQKWAGEHRLAVVVVTHVRKMEANDPLEMISGTNGLTGAADTILVLNRDADGPKLYGRGRDIEELEKALRFDNGKWSVLGDADDVKRSAERRKVLEALNDAAGAMSPAEVAKEIGAKAATINVLLGKMVKSGEVRKVAYALYVHPGKTGYTDYSSSDSNHSNQSNAGTQNEDAA